MNFGHPYSTLQSLGGVQAAVWGSLVRMAYHVSSTAWGFIKPQSWEIWTNQICVNMPLSLSGFLCLFLHLRMLSLFYSNPIFFSIIILQKELQSTREPGRLDSCSETSWPTVQLYVQPQFCLQQQAVLASYAITFLWINLLLFVKHRGWLFNDCQPYNDSVAL